MGRHYAPQQTPSEGMSGTPLTNSLTTPEFNIEGRDTDFLLAAQVGHHGGQVLRRHGHTACQVHFGQPRLASPGTEGKLASPCLRSLADSISAFDGGYKDCSERGGVQHAGMTHRSPTTVGAHVVK